MTMYYHPQNSCGVIPAATDIYVISKTDRAREVNLLFPISATAMVIADR